MPKTFSAGDKLAPRATIDFESRSACDIKKSGSWRYSLDPTTEVFCLAFRLPNWKAGRVALWHPAFPHLGIPAAGTKELAQLFRWILAGKLVEAHNAFFERGIWNNISVSRYGWPSIPGSQWRCSAAKAAAHSLPRNLDKLATALKLVERKSESGHKLMLKMSKPRKARKKEKIDWLAVHGEAPIPTLWHESKEMLDDLFAYCIQDVITEEAVSHALDDLSDDETEMYTLDQTINERGFLLDRPAINCAFDLIAQQTTALNAEFCALTGGSPNKATQREKIQNWFADRWFVLENMQAPTVEAALQRDDLTPEIQRGLEIVQLMGKSSTAKYQAMLNWICPDDRVHGGLLYHGASTGRWTGAGIQPHNFPKGKIKDIEATWAVLKAMDVGAIQNFLFDGKHPVGSVLKLLSQALRGAIISPPGQKLFVADYAAIEARVLLWLAEDEDALEVFRRGDDIYCEMASAIYGYPVVANPASQPPERALGKIAVLGLGYQMGAPKFVATCANFGIVISDDLGKQTVEAYRAKFSSVKTLWYRHQDAAIQAVRQAGPVRCGLVTWEKVGDFLYCTLPSGRRLAYPYPQMKMVKTSWGENKWALTYMGVDPKTKQWKRQSSYGGLLVENLVQAISRDIMAAAMLRLEHSGIYKPILSVHDELLAYANELLGDTDEFAALVAELPDWAAGCPIDAEAWSGRRYRK